VVQELGYNSVFTKQQLSYVCFAADKKASFQSNGSQVPLLRGEIYPKQYNFPKKLKNGRNLWAPIGMGKESPYRGEHLPHNGKLKIERQPPWTAIFGLL